MTVHNNKPPRPFPYRADSLWRHCLWAIAPGWHVHAADTSDEIEEDDVARTAGIVDGSLAGVYDINQSGRVITSGSSADKCQWSDARGFYDWTNETKMSAAILFRHSGSPSSGARFFGKRAGGAPANPGFEFLNNGGNFQVDWSNGTTEDTVGSSIAVSSTVPQLFVFTFDSDNDGAKIYVDGVLVGTEGSPTANVGNNNRVIEIFGVASTTAANGEAGMAGLWDRELTPQEVSALWSDPYRMWRAPRSEFAQQAGNPPASTDFPNFFLSF